MTVLLLKRAHETNPRAEYHNESSAKNIHSSCVRNFNEFREQYTTILIFNNKMTNNFRFADATNSKKLTACTIQQIEHRKQDHCEFSNHTNHFPFHALRLLSVCLFPSRHFFGPTGKQSSFFRSLAHCIRPAVPSIGSSPVTN